MPDLADTPLQLVHKQAEDDGLWFHAETCAEAYVQQELRKLHDAVERAALTPPTSADAVALVDALLKEEIKAGRIECYCGGQAFKRGYEAARLSQKADRDAVIEECSSVPFMIDGMPSSLAHKTKEAILSLKEKHT